MTTEESSGSGAMIGSVDETKGLFFDSLVRNNKQIKQDRAQAISEDSFAEYKKFVEDLIRKRRQLIRARNNMLDMSPENSFSLKMASNFDAAEFVAKDNEIGIQLRELNIQIEVACARFEELFGTKII